MLGDLSRTEKRELWLWIKELQDGELKSVRLKAEAAAAEAASKKKKKRTKTKKKKKKKKGDATSTETTAVTDPKLRYVDGLDLTYRSAMPDGAFEDVLDFLYGTSTSK